MREVVERRVAPHSPRNPFAASPSVSEAYLGAPSSFLVPEKGCYVSRRVVRMQVDECCGDIRGALRTRVRGSWDGGGPVLHYALSQLEAVW